MQVALVTVGDELLAGDTVNTNAAWLGQQLHERGATVARTIVIPDEVATIQADVAALSERYDAVIVTGGVGPTHDDVTMDAVASAFDRELTEHADAVAYFQRHDTYSAADLTTGTTHLPAGARLLENPRGVAPGAAVNNVYVLPGVPDEMKGMFETVADEFTGEQVYTEEVSVDAPESALIDTIAALQEAYDVTVGSYPGDRVRVKIQHSDADTVRAAADWFRDRVTAVSRE
ncbi:competence/damage-inducible protein A [Halobacterium salinarum]|uniref:ADP-ribose pyrophosphatase n=3 Tax=Halobacterium salinarum TaxID=2242 RepID=Q9HRC4_HALSA|nr:competence/damage-inducible protein A [Halobacterium salinarum]AAG19234.1 competence-damage protein CinA-like [Halobacterium salinarum NRC-1]MBB6090078.1 molybdenum cofactor synthesis domain-containing protein [Halobacterium salinarum]MCF2207950.1 competence/damage-inducible protein A [Halobacterium salinarum]MDL0120792.1 competence/damage-inducible protein A [Halobacterium salinarum]MDL0127304.1 competence/damage-inducible protein A [Halobacterium salinarum]